MPGRRQVEGGEGVQYKGRRPLPGFFLLKEEERRKIGEKRINEIKSRIMQNGILQNTVYLKLEYYPICSER